MLTPLLREIPLMDNGVIWKIRNLQLGDSIDRRRIKVVSCGYEIRRPVA